MPPLFLILIFFLYADLAALEKTIITENGPITYHVNCGWLTNSLKDGKGSGSIFYTSYNVSSNKPRPITFCFNGGPGSSSAWLHQGFGPRCIDLSYLKSLPETPLSFKDNIYTLLPITDLIFVDPISTGFSRAQENTSASLFFEFESDGYSLADFIISYLRQNGMTHRPLFLMGSSFATLRIVEIAYDLEHYHKINTNGLLMISTLLNYASINDPSLANDYPYLLTLPTYASTSHYYQIGSSNGKDLFDWIFEARDWSWTEYRKALLEGDSLSTKKKNKIAEKFSYYTGIPKAAILNENLRISPGFFLKEFLRKDNKTIGRFDVRYTGIDRNGNRRAWFDYDPSYSILCPIATGFLTYLQTELQFTPPPHLAYYFLGKTGNWKLIQDGSKFLSVNKKLKDLFLKQPRLHLFVASGIYDVATPFAATQYDLLHLGISEELKKRRIRHHLYKSGHMLYTDNHVQRELSDDLLNFFSAALATESMKASSQD